MAAVSKVTFAVFASAVPLQVPHLVEVEEPGRPKIRNQAGRGSGMSEAPAQTGGSSTATAFKNPRNAGNWLAMIALPLVSSAADNARSGSAQATTLTRP